MLFAFAAVALLLALIGIYGVMVQAVVQRKVEIGIRMALGAAPLRVVALMVRQALLPALAGMTVGLAAAAATVPLLSIWLFGVGPFDRMTWVTVAVLALAVCALASYVPAWRAGRIDPNAVLRAE